MSEVSAVTWTKIPIVGLPDLACQCPTTEDGRAFNGDEPISLDLRKWTCGRDGYWMLGAVPLCKRHAKKAAALMGDDIAEIEKAWRDRL